MIDVIFFILTSKIGAVVMEYGYVDFMDIKWDCSLQGKK